METFSAIVNFFSSPLFELIVKLFFLFLIVLWLSLAYWTYRDAEARGALPLYWAAVVLFFNLFGWLVYLIVRPPELLADVRERELEIRAKERSISGSEAICPECGKAVDRDFLVCPYCMKKLKNPCPHCEKPLMPSWPVCPYCRGAI